MAALFNLMSGYYFSSLELITINVILLQVFTQSTSSYNCLTKCDCVYSRNKLHADCSAQSLTELPKPVKGNERYLQEIQVINLTRNNFVELKIDIFANSHLINLQRIYLRKAGLERIHKTSFYKLVQLVELDLSFNLLKEIPSEAFKYIPKLKTLDLSSNQIDAILDNNFQYLTNLKSLSLVKNRIKIIENSAFYDLNSLEILKLSDNRLSYLESRALSPLNRVHSIYLNGNPWNCDCKMRKLRQTLMFKRINVPDEPRCANFKKIWTELGLDSFLCAPKIAPNDSVKLYPVEQGKDFSLECSFYLDEGFEFQPLVIKWYWKDRPISNNSEGVIPNQHFYIREFDNLATVDDKGQRRKLRTSRLEIIFILKLNQGNYSCQAKNDAGQAGHNFTVEVTSTPIVKYYVDPNSPAAAASIEANRKRYSNLNDSKEPGRNYRTSATAMYGPILGVLFGVFITAALFGTSIIVFCRKRPRARKNLASNRVVAAESELEKLTASSISNSLPSIRPMAPSSLVNIINPVQKPPRFGFLNSPITPTETPQVWLIKQSNMLNNGRSILSNEADDCSCDTQLPLHDYDTNPDCNNLTIVPSTVEPDLIHHQNLTRNRLMFNEEQMSIHSDGTEV